MLTNLIPVPVNPSLSKRGGGGENPEAAPFSAEFLHLLFGKKKEKKERKEAASVSTFLERKKGRA